MFARSMIAAGLFFQMTLVLEAQMLRQHGQPAPAQQRVPGMRTNQMQQGMQPGMQQGMPFESSGTIEAIGQGKLQINETSGVKRIVTFSNLTVIKTTGEATVDFIKPGVCVAFKTEVDGKGNITGKIEELQVVTPSKDNQPGVYPEGGMAGPMTGGGAKKGAAAAPVMSKVVGQIKGVKNGKYQLQAGRSNVQFELSEKPKLTIDVANGALATKGDKVEVKGFVAANAPNQAQAQFITITLAETLGENKANEVGKLDMSHPPKALKAKKSGKAEGLPVPAEDK